MSQPTPLYVQLPPNSTGPQMDCIQLTVNQQTVLRQNAEIAMPVCPQLVVATQNVAANSVGSAITCPIIPNGKTGYLAKVKMSSAGFVSAGAVGSAYTLCASGCSAPITASPIVVLASTHLQGVNAFAYAFDALGNEIFPPAFSVVRDSSGDLTITYTATPARIVITGPSSDSPLSCNWQISAGSTLLGYAVTQTGSDEYEPPHRFYDQCPALQAFSVTPTNPGSQPITVFCSIWYDQF